MRRALWTLAMIMLAPWTARADAVVHHDLRVQLLPETGRIIVSDVISVPAADETAPAWRLYLHPDLKITRADPPLRALPADPGTTRGPAAYVLQSAPRQGRITLSYEGKIAHPLRERESGLGRSQADTRGFITADGVYLDGNSHWYPQFDDERVSFSLDVQLPAAWSAVSQGARIPPPPEQNPSSVRWEENHPQQEIYLIAARFHEYQQTAGAVNTLVMLRRPDRALAEKYLATMAEYVDLYSQLIAPYPYAKFALVENSWESGYGMPSFTLLGPQVIRLPFILHSSLPHEILHNWWGNGVYVDYAAGNWSEGLTSYLADHLLRERRGEGANYRRDALLRYRNYVAAERDFPLSEFSARHSSASQAVGYDKALMFFHTLRLQLGDARFIAGLRRFYRDNAFQTAGWNDLRIAFEKEAGVSLQAAFPSWLQRTGAPSLRVATARATPKENGYQLKLVLEQTQEGPPYPLQVPIAVTLEGQDTALQQVVTMNDKRSVTHLQLAARPWRVEVDPEFDVFRRLDRDELPPTLSEALAAERLLIVLPAAAPPNLREVYTQLAQAWARESEHISIGWDDKLRELPADRGVWLFGWENRFQPQLAAALAGAEATLGDATVTLTGQTLQRKQHAVVLSARQKGTAGQALVWLGCDNPAAFAGLARKLPHYGNASYIAFSGNAPTNILKGQWRITDSPLNVAVTQADGTTPPAATATRRPRPALTEVMKETW